MVGFCWSMLYLQVWFARVTCFDVSGLLQCLNCLHLEHGIDLSSVAGNLDGSLVLLR